MEFSENTRVKIPALVHATRLGYKYLSLKEVKNQLDTRMNIFKTIFKDSINKINISILKKRKKKIAYQSILWYTLIMKVVTKWRNF